MIQLVHTVAEVRSAVKQWRAAGESVGLVPTMGFLHEGHASLMEKSTNQNDHTVVSIFVNPMQFSPGEDLETYPRDLDRDMALCEAQGVDLVFAPAVDEVYGAGFASEVKVSGVSEGLCGRTRPNFYGGICTVVSKLFNIVAPDRAYFGKKDSQQLAVIRRMVKDLNFDIELVGCEIIREADGLAKSSRNTYLTEEERAIAPKIHDALLATKRAMQGGMNDAKALEQYFVDQLAGEEMLTVQYAELVDWENMKAVQIVKGDGSCLLAVAVFLGKARLIDNIDL